MRFMLLLKANRDTEAGAPPTRELLEAMGRFNEEMADAGVLLGGEGLQPTSRGARVIFSGDKRDVVQGPFDGAGLIAGFWLIQVHSLQEAIDWAKRTPAPFGDGVEAEIEIRPLYELSDFPEEVVPPEVAAREQALRERLQHPPLHS